MYLFTISSLDIDKVAMSLYDIINHVYFSIVDITVLYREVALIQRQICAQLCVWDGIACRVLIREVSCIQSVLYREVLHFAFR